MDIIQATEVLGMFVRFWIYESVNCKAKRKYHGRNGVLCQLRQGFTAVAFDGRTVGPDLLCGRVYNPLVPHHVVLRQILFDE